MKINLINNDIKYIIQTADNSFDDRDIIDSRDFLKPNILKYLYYIPALLFLFFLIKFLMMEEYSHHQNY